MNYHRVVYATLAVLALPFCLYVFVYLPLSPSFQVLPILTKIDELPVHLTPVNRVGGEGAYAAEGAHAAAPTTAISRMVLIGDIHGCFDQLVALLDKIRYNEHTDAVVMLGDFISKGPDSIKVLDYAIDHGFYSIMGNHELSILSKYFHSKDLPFNDGDVYKLPKKLLKFDDESKIALNLKQKHLNYLFKSPLFLKLGPVPFAATSTLPGIATHLGFEPDVPLERQKIQHLLSMPKKWYKDFKEWIKSQPLKDRFIVYYGHYSGVGLNIKKYTKGLDSSCVKGGALTCEILWCEEIANQIVYKQELYSVECTS